jgi:XTP/dITP diphosphohydrolase
MVKLVFATNNQHKLREIREIAGNEIEIISLEEAGFQGEIPEDAETLEGNASQKAQYIYDRLNVNCFADDTGLEIEALGGRPGVYSARYAGEDCSFADNILKVLKELDGVENRKACFRCVISLIIEWEEYLFEGRVDGKIIEERKGEAGFGYDPVFTPDGHHQTFAEMPPYLKNGISHRGRAMRKMVRFLADRRTSGHVERLVEGPDKNEADK